MGLHNVGRLTAGAQVSCYRCHSVSAAAAGLLWVRRETAEFSITKS